MLSCVGNVLNMNKSLEDNDILHDEDSLDGVYIEVSLGALRDDNLKIPTINDNTMTRQLDIDDNGDELNVVQDGMLVVMYNLTYRPR